MMIDDRSKKQYADAEVQPEHQKNNGSQTSVHVRIVVEITEIQGKKVGKKAPADHRDQCSRNLMERILLFPWQYRINANKTKEQQNKRKTAADPHDMLCCRSKERQEMNHGLTDGIAKHQNDQGCNAGKDKDDCVDGTDQPSHNIISRILTGIDPVQPPFDTHDTDGRRPQGRDGSDGKYGPWGTDVKVIDDTDDDGMERLRRDTDQELQKIGLSDGWDKLQQSQKQHKKRKSGYDNEKGRLRSINRSFGFGVFLINMVTIVGQRK